MAPIAAADLQGKPTAVDRTWLGNPVSGKSVRLILGMDHGHIWALTEKRATRLSRAFRQRRGGRLAPPDGLASHPHCPEAVRRDHWRLRQALRPGSSKTGQPELAADGGSLNSASVAGPGAVTWGLAGLLHRCPSFPRLRALLAASAANARCARVQQHRP
ncbi:hypothetical protein [Hoeflea olei]|uniref:hypothetical protein n=1 Tax=Hoeflea olei TaxID=1480615 RepID=UPI001495ABC0|nr:hypothetical protein [Hoeflea olei]